MRSRSRPSTVMSGLPKRRIPAVVAVLLALMVAVAACATPAATPTTATTAAKPTSATAASPTTAAKPTTVAGTPAAATTPGSTASMQACPPAGAATTLTGAGATFPAPLYTRWFDEYKKLCNVSVNYQPIGSGGGIRQHTEKTVDFGASDGIMTASQKEATPDTLMIPMTAGAVAVVVNLEGVENGKLRLTPDILAGIYLGEIARWDDAKIKAENADLALPSSAITVVRRSDGSGTTNIFTSYLAAISTDWKSKVGSGNSVQWPTGLGGEGNSGVAGVVKQRAGSIGYVEQAYAAQNKLTWVALKNQAGSYVEPTLEATTAALEGVTIPDNTEVMVVNSANAQAYPIAGLTWLLVYRNQPDAAKAQTLASVIWWAIHDGQKLATEMGYAGLSPAAIAKAEVQVKQIAVNGQAVIK